MDNEIHVPSLETKKFRRKNFFRVERRLYLILNIYDTSAMNNPAPVLEAIRRPSVNGNLVALFGDTRLWKPETRNTARGHCNYRDKSHDRG